MEKERKEERGKKKAKSKVKVRDTFIMWEGDKDHQFIGRFPRLPPARRSGTSSRKMELYEDGKKRMCRMVTVVA